MFKQESKKHLCLSSLACNCIKVPVTSDTRRDNSEITQIKKNHSINIFRNKLKKFSNQNSEYDQEIPQSQNADKPMSS